MMSPNISEERIKIKNSSFIDVKPTTSTPVSSKTSFSDFNESNFTSDYSDDSDSQSFRTPTTFDSKNNIRIKTKLKSEFDSLCRKNSLHEKNLLDNSNKNPLKKNYLSHILLIFILAIGICFACFPLNDESMNINATDSLKKLNEFFPKQSNETFIEFDAVIDDILVINPTHPAVFLLLYTTKNDQIDKLVQHLANYASKKLNSKENYIEMNKNEYNSDEALKDYGYLIDKYKKDLINKKVMVVKDLQEIPFQIARAFHSLCDEVTPLVQQVVYIFTLKVDSLEGKPQKIAEQYLKNSWGELKMDILMPLITRVTSSVFKITT